MTKRKIECPFCSRFIATDARERLRWHCSDPRGGGPCNGSGEDVSDLCAKQDKADRDDWSSRLAK